MCITAKRVIYFVALFFNTFSVWSKDYVVTSFGAIGDGKTLNTASIQAAIDQAYQDKGGRVVIPPGKFLSGSLVMKSGVELHLLSKGVLMGSTELTDYFAISKNNWRALLMAEGAKNISISGKGIIDGQGTHLALKIDSLFYAGQLDSSLYQFKEKRPVAHARPQIIQFVNCSFVEVRGITIKNSASWVQQYDLCNHVVIDRIKVESVAYWNNDGMDIIDSKNVRITNCQINSSDDGICVKSYQRAKGIEAYCDSLYIGNCIIRSSASAVKLGTSSFGGFRNVVIENIKVYDTYRSAIALECWETGILENVLIQNIKATNTGNALFIRLSQRATFKEYPMGALRNITIRNVKASIPYEQADKNYELRGPALPFFHNIFPASITGIPGYRVENVLIENVKITYPGRGNKAYAHLPTSRIADIPEKIEEYPEYSMFGELPAWGFYVRHVDGLIMNDIKLKIKKPDYRPAVVFDDVKKLQIESFKTVGDVSDEPPFYFKDVQFLK